MAHAWAVAFSVGRRNWFMASIERTVYPRFTRAPSVKELREIYTPTPTDVAFVATTARGPAQKFGIISIEGGSLTREHRSRNGKGNTALWQSVGNEEML